MKASSLCGALQTSVGLEATSMLHLYGGEEKKKGLMRCGETEGRVPRLSL